MKHIIFLIFLIFPFIAYGQDLIITTTGDSIKCKIIELDDSEIQFRFGPESVININRKEVKTYEYNFFSRTSTDRKNAGKNQQNSNEPVKKPKENMMPQPPKEKLPPFYLALSGGISSFGTASFVTLNSGGPLALGADVAYFFTKWIGAGVKLNLSFCEIDFDEDKIYNETVSFIGPALYGRFGSKRIAFISDIGVGMLGWGVNYSDDSPEFKSFTPSFGGYVSGGVNFMFTKNIGINLKVNSVIGYLSDDYDNERNPTSIGGAFGFTIRF